jgi:Tol biopolymer transport system component
LLFARCFPSGRSMTEVDRSTRERRATGSRAGATASRVSPDGARVAVERFSSNGNRDIWILDLERLTQTQVTDGPTEDLLPLWAPDGHRVWFASNRPATTTSIPRPQMVPRRQTIRQPWVSDAQLVHAGRTDARPLRSVPGPRPAESGPP